MADPTRSPLKGKRVIVTRAIEQTADLLARLTARGATPISLPLVSFAPPEDCAALDAALDRWNSFDWVIFTSANAVRAVATRAEIHPAGQSAHTGAGKKPRIAAVGPATQSAAASSGFSPDYVAKTHLGVALAEELGHRLTGKSVFLPRSDRANPDLPAALRKHGANVTEVVAYRTLPSSEINQSDLVQSVDHEADAILFFSPSAVHNFADLAGRDRLRTSQDKIAIVAVGPVTARALHELGVTQARTASDTITAAVVDTLEQHFANSATSSSSESKSESSQPRANSGATSR